MRLTTIYIGSAVLVVIGAALFFLLSSPNRSTAYEFIATQAIPHGEVRWEMDVHPAIALEPNTFRLLLHDQAGNPLEDAELQVSLDMIGMVCGDYSFSLTESSPGVYEGVGMPLMAGRWKASLAIRHPDFEHIEIANTFKAVYR